MCVLRVYGKTFDSHAFVSKTSMPVIAVFRRGEPRRRGVEEESGVHIDVSNAEWDSLSKQFDDTVAFYQKHADELREIHSLDGVETIVLDYPLNQRIGVGGIVTQSETIPLRVLRIAVEISAELTISIYPPLQEEEN